MDHCDKIICVSNLTRKIVIENYHQPEDKVVTVHNAVDPLNPEIETIERLAGVPEKLLLFLAV